MNKELTIIQYNTNRSKDIVMAQIIRYPTVMKASIIVIHEPWANPYQETTHHPANQTYQLLYPESSETGGDRARVCMFVSKRIEGQTHIVYSKDCQEVRVRNIEEKEFRIFNIYNQPNNGEDTVNLLSQLIPPTRDQEPGVSYLVVGDFHLHYPHWKGEGVPQEVAAEELLDVMETRGMDLWLKPGSITRNQAGSQTTIDLVFATEGLDGRMVDCQVLEQIHEDSDHLPIRTIIDFDTPQPEQEKKRWNWKAIDEDKFSKFVQTNLQGKPWLRFPGEVTPRRIDDAVEFIMEVIQRGVQESTPWARPSSRANPSFTPECSEAIKVTRRLYRTWRMSGEEDD